MIKIPGIEKLKKEEKKLSKSLDACIKAYEKAKKKASCGLCSSYRKEMLSGGKLHVHCGTCFYRAAVQEGYEDLMDAKKALDDFERDVYAKTIFDSLNPFKPGLIETKTGKSISWNEAFGESYSENLESRKYRRIIALFDEVMSPIYQLAD